MTILIALSISSAFANYPISELRVGINTLPRTIEPFFDTTTTALGVYRNMFDTLVQVDADGAPTPSLAEGWEVTPEGAWSLRLRQDAYFHDGTPFTADDAKYSLDWVLDPENNAPWAGRISLVRDVAIVDDHTILLRTEEPWAALPQGLMVIHMVPQGYYDGAYNPEVAPVGTGRYRFLEWSPDDYLVMEAIDDSWHGPTTVQRIRYIEMPTASTRSAALRAGEIEVAYAVPPEHVEELEGSGVQVDFQLIGHSLVVVLVSTRDDALSDRRVRQAINYAVDKEAIVDFLMEGFGRTLDGQMVGPDGFGYSAEIEAYPYDPERARELLAEAGYSDGLTIGFNGTTAMYLKDREVSEAVANMLSEVGINVDMEILEQTVWAEGLYSNSLEPMFMIAFQYLPAMDVALPFTFLQCTPRSFADLMCNEDFDRLMDEAQRAFDIAERERYLQEAAAVLRDEANVLFLHQLPAIYGVAPGLSGIRFNADTTIDFHEAAFE